MTNRFKIFLVVFVLSLPFWWGMNILAGSLEDFWFWDEMAKNPQIFIAQVRPFEIKAEEKQNIESQAEELKPVKTFVDDLTIRAKAAISVEIDSKGQESILFEKKSQNPLPIASLTKLMTALVIFDLGETYIPFQLIPITKTAVGQEGSSKYGELKEKEYFSVEVLVHVMLIESSNDAAYALTELIGVEGFVGLMNLYAKDIGLENTKFINSTGLEPNNPGESRNYSTPQDLVKLTKYILKTHPRIFEITNKDSYQVLNPDGSVHHFIPRNTNKLLREIPEIFGGKTGWNPVSQGCLLLVLDNPSKNSYFVNIVLGAGDRFEEMRKLIKLTNDK